MRIGVTGGLGLLGQAVVGCLIDRGHTPVIIDRSVTTARSSGRSSDRSRYEPGEVEQIKADICSKEQITEACEGLDGVIHTASLIDLHLGRPTSLYDVNVTGAKNVVLACRDNGIQKLVHMSSAEAITSRFRVSPKTKRSIPATN